MTNTTKYDGVGFRGLAMEYDGSLTVNACGNAMAQFAILLFIVNFFKVNITIIIMRVFYSILRKIFKMRAKIYRS